jgi:hypothetical protein
MAAMTILYPVSDPNQLDGVGPGDEITADVVVTDRSSHLENIVVVKKAEPELVGRLRPQMPGDLRAGDGQQAHRHNRAYVL